MTRDSLVWWIGIAVGIVSYLIDKGTPPVEWVYLDWLLFIGVMLGILSGKLATSPLRGKHDPTTIQERRW